MERRLQMGKKYLFGAGLILFAAVFVLALAALPEDDAAEA